MSFATLRKTVCTDIDIGTALKEITSNPHIGDVLAFDLLDGRRIECTVTDIDDKAIRFDSVDCLGDDMAYGKVENGLTASIICYPMNCARLSSIPNASILSTARKLVVLNACSCPPCLNCSAVTVFSVMRICISRWIGTKTVGIA